MEGLEEDENEDEYGLYDEDEDGLDDDEDDIDDDACTVPFRDIGFRSCCPSSKINKKDEK